MTVTNAVAEKIIARGIIIKTSFLGPTNYKGSRVTASHKRDNEKTYRATIEWRHDCDAPENHARAAQALINVINSDRRSTFIDLGIEPPAPLEIVGEGWDNDNYFFLAALP